MRFRFTRVITALLLVGAVGLTGCAQQAAETTEEPTAAVEKKDGPEVRVGSLMDSEGVVLGTMIVKMLDRSRSQGAARR
jgi:glycine betaine/choline ABC-type transport system substrate-binding protein